MNDEPAEVLSSERLHEGRIFDVLRERVRLPSGLEQDLEFVRHGGAVAIAALRDDGRLVLVRQYRHATGVALLEVPAGRLRGGRGARGRGGARARGGDRPARRALARARALLRRAGLLLGALGAVPGRGARGVRARAARRGPPTRSSRSCCGPPRRCSPRRATPRRCWPQRCASGGPARPPGFPLLGRRGFPDTARRQLPRSPPHRRAAGSRPDRSTPARASRPARTSNGESSTCWIGSW